jgi:hypothetical protein
MAERTNANNVPIFVGFGNMSFEVRREFQGGNVDEFVQRAPQGVAEKVLIH